MIWLSALLLAAAAPAPARVASPTVPGFALTVAPRFRALPPIAFPIENLTDAERRIFVEADRGGRVRRLVIVQFETVKPGADFRFRYPSRPPRQLGAETYRSGTYVYDDQAAATAAPDKEAARTRAFLAQHRLAPARVYRVARLARVADAQGLSEVIIFYMENADRDFAPVPLPNADEDGDVPITGADQQALWQRMEMAIAPAGG